MSSSTHKRTRLAVMDPTEDNDLFQIDPTAAPAEEKMSKNEATPRTKHVSAEEESESSQESEIYQVEAILDRKRVKNSMRYLLKWAGYDEATWEDESNLIGCEELLAEFEEKMKQLAAKPPSKRGRKRRLQPNGLDRSSTASTPLKVLSPEASSHDGVGTEPVPCTPMNHEEGDTILAPAEWKSITAHKDFPNVLFVHDEDAQFGVGAEPVEIINAKRMNDKLYLGLVLSIESKTKCLVYFLASVLYNRIPGMVFEFYESKIRFH